MKQEQDVHPVSIGVLNAIIMMELNVLFVKQIE